MKTAMKLKIRWKSHVVTLFVSAALKGCNGSALFISRSTSSTSETTVVATRCEFANSEYGTLVYGSLSSAKFNNCLFHSNRFSGIYACQSTIHLYGEATALHSNEGHVIFASHHNTLYNNGGGDQQTMSGATITYYYQQRRLKV